MDGEIAKWILEFLLRQRKLEERALDSLLEIVPVPYDDYNLRKLILLKKLESKALSNLISEDMLDHFEGIEEIECNGGVRSVSDAMKRAYCAVAVESTVKQRDGVSFFLAVKRVWKGRMEKVVGKGRLSSVDLLRWKGELEAAVWEDDACERVSRRCNEEINAAAAVCAYVREENEKLGPSFLESVADKMKNDEHVKGAFGVVDKEMHKDIIQPMKKCNGMKRSGRLNDRSCGVRIVDPDENPLAPSQVNGILPGNEEVHKVPKSPESSSREGHVVAGDALRDALQHSEEACDIGRKNETHDIMEKNNRVEIETNLSTMACGGVAQGYGCDISNPHRPSTMEHCDSVYVHESDDKIDASPEREIRGNCTDMVLLGSPSLLGASPLSSYDSSNRKKRRKARKWTEVEEDALRAGIQRFGQGSWKVILTTYRDVLSYRTEVDLKDKWRNLNRP